MERGLKASLPPYFLWSRSGGILGFNQAHLSIPQHRYAKMMDCLEKYL